MTDFLLMQVKLTQLREYIADLQELSPLTYEEYVSNKQIRRYAERTLQILIECALDIGNHIISDNNWREPRNNKDVFLALAEHGLISPKLSAVLQKMAQFRNLIVHDYSRIDNAIVFGIIKRNTADLTEYSRSLQDYGETGAEMD